ncbi:MAG: VOC family protein [Candidatus Promineifilaceae bacterium]
MSAKYIPEGYHTVTPYLVVIGVAELIKFLEEAFDAEQRELLTTPDGGIMHAEVKIGDSTVMMGEPSNESDAIPALLYLYVEDVNAAYKKAIEAGATSLREPEDQFYGDRSAAVRDASGNQWWLATHVEDVPADEMQKRASAD